MRLSTYQVAVHESLEKLENLVLKLVVAQPRDAAEQHAQDLDVGVRTLFHKVTALCAGQIGNDVVCTDDGLWWEKDGESKEKRDV